MVHALIDHARLCSSDDNFTKARLPSLSAQTEWTRKPPKVPRCSRLRLRAPPASSLSSLARKTTFAVARGVFALSRAAAPPSLVSSQSTTPQGGIRAVEDFRNYDHCDYLGQDLERSQIQGKDRFVLLAAPPHRSSRTGLRAASSTDSSRKTDLGTLRVCPGASSEALPRTFPEVTRRFVYHAPGMELRRLLFLTIVAPAAGLRARRFRV